MLGLRAGSLLRLVHFGGHVGIASYAKGERQFIISLGAGEGREIGLFGGLGGPQGPRRHSTIAGGEPSHNSGRFSGPPGPPRLKDGVRIHVGS